jgi:hypothetical protein
MPRDADHQFNPARKLPLWHQPLMEVAQNDRCIGASLLSGPSTVLKTGILVYGSTFPRVTLRRHSFRRLYTEVCEMSLPYP